ncbi:hypothetical protein BaRGS_00033233 [Batillaria attramentaria]|uniref:Uncharacterized protein n=1 Tax=Batillaria attramentaria TaxID=370345 RepID=A0ABD0JKY5_9CAEN
MVFISRRTSDLFSPNFPLAGPRALKLLLSSSLFHLGYLPDVIRCEHVHRIELRPKRVPSDGRVAVKAWSNLSLLLPAGSWPTERVVESSSHFWSGLAVLRCM